MTKILDVYLQDKIVGLLEQAGNGHLTFTYEREYLDTASYGISLSLPLRAESYNGPEVKSFFSGLLPEEGVRNRLAKYLGLSEKNPFSLSNFVRNTPSRAP